MRSVQCVGFGQMKHMETPRPDNRPIRTGPCGTMDTRAGNGLETHV